MIKKWFNSKCTWLYVSGLSLCIQAANALDAHANYSNGADMANGIEETIVAWGPVVAKLAFLAGLGLTGWGIVKLATGGTSSRGGQDGKIASAICILCGGALMGLVAFSDVLSGTMTGGSAEGLGELGIQ